MSELQTIADIPKENLLSGGTAACPGCGSITGLKMALLIMGKDTVVVNSSGCMTLLCNYPRTPLRVPWIHNAIENAPSTASGIIRAAKRLGKKLNVLCYCGDGATYDIGLQALSAAIARNEDFVYICYNNGSFGNTGDQWSTATPLFANTTTTPVGRKSRGNTLSRKDMAKIIGAHGCYSATASLAYPLDYLRKVKKAKEIKGPAYIELLAHCPTDWHFDSGQGMKISRLAVQTGVWPLYEVVDGVLYLQSDKTRPVEDFLKTQGRFKHLTKRETAAIQAEVDKEWDMYKTGEYWKTDEY
ncbi:MAG: pyruvate synthase subunit beta [Candidatus Diapherotrites archaeon]|nr:pyruvate synthase subunit beta [Candidatus Diapherotrites archaeon]